MKNLAIFAILAMASTTLCSCDNKETTPTVTEPIDTTIVDTTTVDTTVTDSTK